MTDQHYLQQAIEMSQQSPEPVGCGVLIVQSGKVLAKTHNSQRADNIAVNHAEIKAIIEANNKPGRASSPMPLRIVAASRAPCA